VTIQKLDFNDYFYYDETSPSCLRWKIDRFRGINNSCHHTQANSIAGSLNKKGYWKVGIGHKKFAVHRIILELHGQSCEGKKVDHIDKNTLNNTIENLRAVSHMLNMHNLKLFSTNKTGFTGVLSRTDYRSGHYYDVFVAIWKGLDGKQKSRSFSINKYGKEEAFRLACQCRSDKIKELNSNGAGYTDGHGK